MNHKSYILSKKYLDKVMFILKKIGLFLIIFTFILSCSNTSINDNNLKKAKNFKLPMLNGQQSYSLKEFEGKPVILNFWASWCAPCREEMPFIQKAWKDYKTKGIQFIGINIMDDKDEAIKVLESLNINYLNLYDPPGEVSKKYNVLALPVTIFIDKYGNIIQQNYGPYLGKSGEEKFRTSTNEILN